MNTLTEEELENQKKQSDFFEQYYKDFAAARIKDLHNEEQKEKWAEFIKKYPNGPVLN